MESRNATARALAGYLLVAAASVAAASLWAQARPADGYMLDARGWVEEVNAAGPVPWPADGWWRLQLQDKSIEVVPVRPGDGMAVPPGAIYLRLPGAPLQAGARRTYPYIHALHRPQLGTDYELALGRSRFSLRVENVVKGMAYTVGYGGESHTYVLGPFDATATGVRAIADLDGDSQPDLLVDVDDTTYLLLSTRALPGFNLPTAQLWEPGGLAERLAGAGGAPAPAATVDAGRPALAAVR